VDPPPKAICGCDRGSIFRRLEETLGEPVIFDPGADDDVDADGAKIARVAQVGDVLIG
jgi:hypothetical protein